jgi:hypothetical protein
MEQSQNHSENIEKRTVKAQNQRNTENSHLGH